MSGHILKSTFKVIFWVHVPLIQERQLSVTDES